jgi:AmmeMemoRadiSam system protein A
MSGAELTEVERDALLRLARGTIAARLGRQPEPSRAGDGRLSEPAGAFVTLKRRHDGDLRGCVGYVEPVFPLFEVVARAAVAAALEDRRFHPVTADELPGLAVGISVLGPLAAIRPDAVEVGRHGLVVRWAGQSGLLLPQVAIEHGWGRESFLDHTCLKAGLPSGAWRHPGAELLAFTATVFAEPEA